MILHFAPMKNRFLKIFFGDNRQRCGVVLVMCAGVLLAALTPGVAQVRNQRRVTGLQLGGAAEGSRVTIVSDTALNDYEAFRRGDRFYVKIPLADLASTVPHLRADGFEDVQTQKAGDGLIVSFKLQPGASARVDQRGARLDVVFSAPNRTSFGNSAATANTPGSSLRGRDAAGPLSPVSIDTSRDRFATDRGVGTEGPSRDPWAMTSRSSSNRNLKAGTGNQSTNANVALSSPSSSPSSVLTPGMSSSYTPLSSATPSVSPAVKPVTTSSTASAPWKQRANAAVQWASANRLATLLGVLILLSLILYLLWLLRGRQDGKAKQAKIAKVQPKYSAADLEELPARAPAEPATRQPSAGEAPRDSEVISAAPISSEPDIRKQPAIASAAAANASHTNQWVLTRPTITPDEHREEEEREVFEL